VVAAVRVLGLLLNLLKPGEVGHGMDLEDDINKDPKAVYAPLGDVVIAHC
jgi:hypothetical protein